MAFTRACHLAGAVAGVRAGVVDGVAAGAAGGMEGAVDFMAAADGIADRKNCKFQAASSREAPSVMDMGARVPKALADCQQAG